MSYRDEFKSVERETYWSAPRVFLGLVLLLVVGYGLGFLATGGDLAIYRFWAPKQENARRLVFENTQSYVEGKTTYLTRLRLQWQEAEVGSVQRAALRQTILTEASTVDMSKLPEDLQLFMSSLKGGSR